MHPWPPPLAIYIDRCGSINKSGFIGTAAAALLAKKIAGAAIDVFDPEPPQTDPLLGLDNVLLTPHMATRTHTAIENMSWVVKDVLEVLHGRPPQHAAP